MGGKIQGIRSIVGRHKIDRGKVKNSVGNGEAKELTSTTRGHEPLRPWEECWRVGGCRGEGDKGDKNLGQLSSPCNSIINKIYLKIVIKNFIFLNAFISQNFCLYY